MWFTALYFLRLRYRNFLHVLWECDVIQNFIKSIYDFLARKTYNIFDPTNDNFILGSPSEDLDCYINILVTIKFYTQI